MPEPISIISITALALSTAKTTKDFVDGIIDAPNAVTATSRDLEALDTILTLTFHAIARSGVQRCPGSEPYRDHARSAIEELHR